MAFTDVFIKRPVFATTVSLIILVLGLMALVKLPLRLYPQIDASVITVSTAYPGANSQLMEGFVTTPIEEALSGIDGIDYMTSSSSDSTSQIVLHFKLGYNINDALTDVYSKVSSTRWKLPQEIQDPIIMKNDPNAQPIMYVSFSRKKMTAEQVSDYLERVVQPKLQGIDGVSQAVIYGDRQYTMRIWLDPTLMAAHHVTATDIEQALENNNIQSSSGRVENQYQEYTVYANTDINTAKDFNDLIIRQDDQGHTVRIKNIGQAELGSQDHRVSVIMDGEATTVVAIIPKANANPLTVVQSIKQVLPDISTHLPGDMKATVIWDTTLFISSSLKEVRNTIIEACLFVFLVIFLMIGSFRAVLIPVVTIPLSLIGACLVMSILGYSFNMMTLLAFVLAIGLVVDDSIVVSENIHRHLALGTKPFQAAIIGAREICFAVIAMSLTLASVYAPIGFMTGLTGKLFSEFAFTLAAAVIISGFLALTLSPMMCSKLYGNEHDLNAGFAGFINRLFDKLMNGYKKALNFVIKMRYVILILVILVYAGCIALFYAVPKDLAPPEDQSSVMSIAFGSAAANLAYTEKQTAKIGEIYQGIPEMIHYGIINGVPEGVSSAISFAVLKPWDQRKRSAFDILGYLYPKLMAIPGIIAFPSNPPTLPGTSGFTPISFVLKTTKDYSYLLKETNAFKEALQSWGGVININSDLKIDQPQTFMNIHRNEALDLGIPMSSIADSLNMFLGTPTITRFNMNGRSYEVVPELLEQYRNTPTALNNLNLRTKSNKLVPLSNLVDIDSQIIPRSLNHFQQLRSATITANLSPNVTQGEALTYMQNLAGKMLPSDIQTDTSDQLRQFIEAAGKMGPLFLFAIIFIYLILAAQFESFKDPFIVMLSVPLSMAGALLLLLVTHASLNIYTQIGLVTLIGLITKNGILIVEFANQQQERGMEFKEALLTGASLRLRPILMTTFAILLGAIPLITASGAGAISRMEMGLVIFGGMSFGTILTLFVIPVAYYLFATKKMKDPQIEEIDKIDSKLEK